MGGRKRNMEPERGTELLWAPGRKGDLNLERIVDRAVELADEKGLGGVSMRRLAERLGFTSMALYRHVRGKAELVALMRERVLGEWEQRVGVRFPATDRSLSWRSAIEAWARQGLELHRRHPWLGESSGEREVPGPNAVAGFERALAAMARTGLPAAEVVAAVTLVGDHVESAAAREAERARAERDSGVDHRRWWGARSSLFDRLDHYPTLTRLYSEGAYECPPDRFEYGLARVLDGIASRIRDETRDETGSGRDGRCPVCGQAIEHTGSGRPRTYCSRACRQRAYRDRHA